MSKRNREKRAKKVTPVNITQSIQQMLRADFACTEEQVELIEQAFQQRVPVDVSAFMQDLADGKAPLPLHRPGLNLEMEDGTVQQIQMTNHPINLLYDYLVKNYGRDFGMLYWNVFLSPDPAEYLEMLKHIKKTGLLNDDITEDGEAEA
jgi:hypothetical protein